MQGKDEMIDDILASARTVASKIIDEATVEHNALIEATRAALEEQRIKTDAEKIAAANAVYDGRIKLGELEVGKIILGAKQKCVSAVYDGVRDRIVAMPSAEYTKLIVRLVSAYVEDGDEIIVGKSDKRLTAEWVKNLSKSTKKKLTLSKEKGDFDAGVVLRNSRYDRDFTVDEIVADLRERTVSDVAKKLGL